MRRLGFLFLCLVLVLCVASLANAKERYYDFTLVNKTGYTIQSIFLAPHSTTEWGDDHLGEDLLKNGQDFVLSFPDDNPSHLFDLKVVYEDGDEAVWMELDLSSP